MESLWMTDAFEQKQLFINGRARALVFIIMIIIICWPGVDTVYGSALDGKLSDTHYSVRLWPNVRMTARK